MSVLRPHFNPTVYRLCYWRVTGAIGAAAAQIVLFRQVPGRILKVHCFPEVMVLPAVPSSGQPSSKPVRKLGSMCLTLQRGGVSAACVVLAVWTASAAELSRYREFELGSSVAAVTAVTLSAERDLKILHNRPALLQEVTWQPRYMTGAPVANRNSIGEMVFSFVDDRLFQMTVVYERGRTTGLTNADMIAALTDIYGVPTGKAAPPRAAADALDTVCRDCRMGGRRIRT